MPRNSNGVYTLPIGNPVTSGAIIESSWANTTMPDLGNEMTDSLSRSGEGGMLAPLRKIDGTVGSPADSWVNDIQSGWHRPGAGAVNYSMSNYDVFTLSTVPDSATELNLYNGTERLQVIVDDGGVYLLRAGNVGGFYDVLQYQDAEEVTLYYAGTAAMRTAAAADGGLFANNLATGLGMERVLTTSDSAGMGGGDFMADGSVAMTGDLRYGGVAAVWDITNEALGSGVRLQVTKANSTVTNVLNATAGAGVSFYYDTSEVARTLSPGGGGFEVNNFVTGSGFERVLTSSDKKMDVVFLDSDSISNYTFLASDLAKSFFVIGGGAFTLTLPVGLGVGFWVNVTNQKGASDVTTITAANVTLRSPAGGSSTFPPNGYGTFGVYADSGGFTDYQLWGLTS